MKHCLFSCFLALSLFGCQKKRIPQEDIGCTEIFKTIGVQIKGLDLDDYFTIREDTGDTLRWEQIGLDEDYYLVLTDQYMSEMRNKTLNFRFKGIRGEDTVVNEPFVIKADNCHIELVSGNTKIDLD